MSFIVGIDGPAGSGKGTVTKIIANKLGLTNIDTGITYRCVALKCLNKQIKLEEKDKIIISTTGVSGMYDHTHGGFVSTGEYSSEWSNICNIENKYVPLSALKCDIGSNNSASNDELVFMQGMSNYAYGNSLTQGSNNSAINNSLAQGYNNKGIRENENG